jgi:hypothetical protein
LRDDLCVRSPNLLIKRRASITQNTFLTGNILYCPRFFLI